MALREVLGWWHSQVAELVEKREQFPSTSGAQEQRQEDVLPRSSQHKSVLSFTAPAIPGALSPWSSGFVPALGSCGCSPKQAALLVKHFHGEEAERGDPAGLGQLEGGVGHLHSDWPWMKTIIPAHLP